jgi:uncharacterized protein
MSGTPNAPELTADAAAGDILRQRIRDFLAEKSEGGLVSAYLFGSVASGSNHRESDVDVAVLLPRERFPRRIERSEERIRLLSGLMAALERNDVDLVVLNDLPPRFGRHVVTVGERLLCLDPETDLRFRCQIQLLAADLDVFMRRMEPLKLEALRR